MVRFRLVEKLDHIYTEKEVKMQLTLWDILNTEKSAEIKTVNDKFFAQILNQESLTISTLDYIDIVEDLIERYMRRHYQNPDLVARLYGSFLFCKSKYKLSDQLIKPHITELLNRIVNNATKLELNEATTSECIVALHNMALIVPPTNVIMFIYAQLVKKVLPSIYENIWDDNHFSGHIEEYPGQIHDLTEKLWKSTQYERAPIESRLPQTWKLKLILGKRYDRFENDYKLVRGELWK